LGISRVFSANTSGPFAWQVNLVVHYKVPVLDEMHGSVWEPLLRLQHLAELDLVTMKFENVRALLAVVGPRLERLTVECDEEQVSGLVCSSHCINACMYA
jgi:hypothetical protein